MILCVYETFYPDFKKLKWKVDTKFVDFFTLPLYELPYPYLTLQKIKMKILILPLPSIFIVPGKKKTETEENRNLKTETWFLL
jgi:hypothetical protein